MFATGIILLIVGLLFLSGLGSLVSACSLFLGITFVIFGMLIRLGFFYGKLFSLNGLSVFLISFSVIFFALAISLLQFVKVDLAHVIPILFRGVLVDYNVVFNIERIYISTSAYLLRIGLGCLIVGLIVRGYDTFRTRGF
jgi:hypothetical protein